MDLCYPIIHNSWCNIAIFLEISQNETSRFDVKLLLLAFFATLPVSLLLYYQHICNEQSF